MKFLAHERKQRSALGTAGTVDAGPLAVMVGTIDAHFPDLGSGYLDVEGVRIGFKKKGGGRGGLALKRGTPVRAWVNPRHFAERIQAQ